MTVPSMFVTWTAVRMPAGSTEPGWKPAGAVFSQAGATGRGVMETPTFDGRWWAILTVWPDRGSALQVLESAVPVGVDVWHTALEAVAYRGDAVLADGAQPFSGLPPRGKTEGASAVITFAGLSAEPAKGTEFFEHLMVLAGDLPAAAGLCAAMVQAPTEGEVLTFSAWDSLRSAVSWAYHQPLHAAVVRRQHEAALLDTTGFLRCAVLGSAGRLGDHPDPLRGLTGNIVPYQERA